MRPSNPSDVFCAHRRHRRREFGKVIIELEVTLQNPEMKVALFMLMKGASREDAAKIGGIDRQTVRTAMARHPPRGLLSALSPGSPGRLTRFPSRYHSRVVVLHSGRAGRLARAEGGLRHGTDTSARL